MALPPSPGYGATSRFVTNAYDAIGQKVTTKILDANGTVLKFENFKYEKGGQVAVHTNALGGVTEYLYTSTGKPRFQKKPDGSTNEWRYYRDGRAQREIQPNRAYWETTYDDPNRRVTRKFYSASGTALTTNVTEFDRRGNTIRSIDAAGFATTNKYDGLDRLKWTAGPVVAPARATNAPTFPPLPPSVQQAATNYYDAAGAVTVSINSAGFTNITYYDGLGRNTRFETYRDTILERQIITTYAPNHHSTTISAYAISNTVFTDNSDNTVLSVGYPAAAVRHFTRSVYDSVGNLTFQTQASVTNSTLVEWSSASTAYDGLSRPLWKSEGDGAITTFQYDPAGNLTNRVIPGGLAFRAIYNTAGQKTQDYILGGAGAGARTNTYSYSSIGSLASRTDNRGVVCDYVYDDWLRPMHLIHDGPSEGQDMLTSFTYDARGLLKRIEEQSLEENGEPGTAIYRTYDPYGQLTGESITVGSNVLYGATQSWNEAGRRSSLGYASGQFAFNMAYRSDGLLRRVYGNTGMGDYGYDTGGRLLRRILTPNGLSGQRVTMVGPRDGAGRPLMITNSIGDSVRMLETLSWTGDGLLGSHTIGRVGDFTNFMEFTHAPQTRRLVEERMDLGTTRRHTNTFAFDNGQAQGPGVLTKASGGTSSASPASWSGTTNALLQIATETNNVVRHLAYGAVNGPATVSALLDGQPMPVSVSGTQALRWLANLELTPGTHQLNARAVHVSGQYTASVTNFFTNSVGNLTATATYDAVGNVTQKIWRNPNGTTNRALTLSWDARGRLWKAIDRDANQSGRNWTGVYDGLGRLLRTTELTVTNSVTNFASSVIDHYYDPQHEFLEIGVSENGQTTWKVMGPDLDGRYGSQSGTGGFEAIVPGPELFCPILSDFRGNLHAVYDVDHAMLMWYSNRVAAYGGVVGYRPLPLGHVGVELGAKCAWRNRWSTSFGFAYLGGNWLSLDNFQFAGFDELGFSGGQGPGHIFCMGNPGDYWDPDGRMASQFAQNQLDALYGRGQGMLDAGSGMAHGTALIGAIAAPTGLFPLQKQFLDQAFQFAQNALDIAAQSVGARNDNMTFVLNAAGAEIAANLATMLVGGAEAKAASMLSELRPPPLPVQPPPIPALARVLEGHAAEQGFTGVFDAGTGNVLLRPSTAEAVIPEGWVARAGGHGQVSTMLGGDASSHSGFAVILQRDGTLNITWRSGTLNPGPDNLVPREIRPTIVNAVESATGRKVNP